MREPRRALREPERDNGMRFDLRGLNFLGTRLRRPECVVAHASGLLIVPDWTPPGGVALIAPGGAVTRLAADRPGPGVPTELRPNGISLEPGGSVLLAHLGDTRGGVYRLQPDGRCETVTDRIGDHPMPPANFVATDAVGRLWITVSTTIVPRALDYRPGAASGVVAVHDGAGTRLATDGLGYTNECLFSADGGTLWVVETFARKLSGYTVRGAELSARRSHAAFGPGDFPDGIAEAADGSLMLTSIVSNRLLRVTPGGRVERLFQDCDPGDLASVEAAFQAGEMGRPHLDAAPASRIGHFSSIAFGGAGLRTAYLGSLLGDGVGVLASPVAGRALPHWNADLGGLAELIAGAP